MFEASLALLFVCALVWIGVQRSRTTSARKAEVDAGLEELFLHAMRNPLTVDEFQKLAPMAVKYPQHFAVLGTMKQFRESIALALSSKNREVAESRAEFAWECVKRVRDAPAGVVSAQVLSEMEATTRAARESFKTALHLNVARGHTDHARALKTDKAKRKHLEFAREELRRGLALGQGDVTTLTTELRAIDSQIAALN